MPFIPPRVLCVDDNEDCRVMLSTLLRLALVEAKTVGTAAQALSLIRTESFNLYLLDARLPDLDGFELCRAMRAFAPHTPILFFSGAASEADRKRAIEAGANAYLIKPEIDGLIETITHYLGDNTARVIPFVRKKSFSPSFTWESAAV